MVNITDLKSVERKFLWVQVPLAVQKAQIVSLTGRNTPHRTT